MVEYDIKYDDFYLDPTDSYFTPDTYANEHSACAARLAAGLCADLAQTIMSGHARNGFALVCSLSFPSQIKFRGSILLLAYSQVV